MFETEKNLKLTDLIDVKFLQEFQDIFAKTMGVASLTVDDKGPITRPSNFTDFCIKYTRTTPEGYRRCNDCDIKWGKLAAKKGEPVVYACHAGLTDFVVPIMVNGKHLGSILGGQVLTKAPDEEKFREVANQIGVDADKYIEALKNVKVMPLEQIHDAANLLKIVANVISDIGSKNLELTERNERDNLHRTIVETVRSSLDIDETKQKIVNIIGKTLNADRCFIVDFDTKMDKFLIVNDEYLSSKAVLGFKGADVNKEIPNFADSVKKGHPLIINNKQIFIQTDNQDFELEQKAIAKYRVNSAFAFPLFYFDEFLGVLAVHYLDDRHSITGDEINLITMIADQIAIALHQARGYKLTQLTAQRETLLRNIIEKIRSSLDLDETLSFICEETAKLFNVQRTAITVFSNYETFEEFSLKKEYKTSEKIKGIGQEGKYPELFVYWGKSLTESREVLTYDNVPESNTPSYFKDIYAEMGVKSMMGTAIKKGDDIWGTLVLSEYNNYRMWTAEEKALLETISYQVYIAVNQAEMYEREQEQAEREILLRKIISVIRGTIDLGEIKHQIVNQVGIYLKADRVAFADYDFEKENYFILPGNEFLSSNDVNTFVGYDFASTPGFIEAIREIHLTGKDIVFSDLDKYLEENNLKGNGVEKFYRDMGFASSMAINIYHGDLFYGNLVITFKEKRDITEDDVKFIKTLADQSGIAIYQSTLYEKEKQAAEREALLRKIFEKIRSTLDLDEVFELVCEELLNIFNAQRSFVVEFKHHPNKNEINIKKELKSGLEIKGLQDKSFDVRTIEYWGDVLLKQGQKIIIDNIPQSDTPDYFKETYLGIGAKSIMGISIKKDDDSWGWVGVSQYDYYRHWTEDDINLLETISKQIYIAIKQAELYKITKINAEREKLIGKVISKAISTFDINQIKQIVNDVGIITNADRCYFAEVDVERMKGKPIDFDGEYLSSPDIKSVIGYDFPEDHVRKFVEIYLNQKDITVFDYEAILRDQGGENDGIKKYIQTFDLKSGVGIPFYYMDKLTAVLVIEYQEKNVLPSDDDLNFLRILGNQVGMAFSQIRLYQDTKKTAKRETLLREVIEVIRGSIDIDETFSIICVEVAKIFKVQRATIVEFLDKNDSGYWKTRREYKAREDIKGSIDVVFDRRVGTYNGQTILRESKNLVIDKLEDSDTPDYFRATYQSMGIKSILSVPIKSGDDKFGIIFLSSIDDYHYWSPEEVKLLESIASQVYVAIKQANLFDNQKKTAERETLLRRIIETVRSSLDIKQVKKEVIEELGKAFNSDRCYFRSYDKSTDKFLPVDIEYLSSDDMKSLVGVEPDQKGLRYFADEIVKRNKGYSPIVMNEQTAKNTPLEEYIQSSDIKADYGIPISDKQEEALWLVLHYSKEDPKLSEEDKKILEVIAYQIEIAFNQIKLYSVVKSTAEREIINRKIIEILRSTIDREMIKHLFVKNIGKYFNANRVFFSDFDAKNNMYLPVAESSQYLSSSQEKSFVNYDWADPVMRDYIQPLIEKRELKIACWTEYIEENPKSQGFVSRFEDANVKSSYNIPVLYQQEIMGYFCIEFTKDSCHKLSNEDIASIRTICSQAGIALYHSGLYIQAQESALSKGEFIENISKELSTPLNNLIGFSEVLSNEGFDCNQQIEYLNKINNSSKQLLDLRKDIEVIAKIESENFELNFEDVDSQLLIREVLDSISPVINKKKLNISLSTIMINVNADRRMLSQILYDLLSEAVSLSPENSQIIISSEFNNNKITIMIDINGLGMSTDNQNIIFEKFKQVDFSYSRQQKGVGLGLSIAKKLVGLHKGSIYVESTTDNGTRIKLIMPNAKKIDQ